MNVLFEVQLILFVKRSFAELSIGVYRSILLPCGTKTKKPS